MTYDMYFNVVKKETEVFDDRATSRYEVTYPWVFEAQF